MSGTPDNLVLEQLRLIRGELSDLRRTSAETQETLLALRHDVHALRGEALARDAAAAELSIWRDRVNRRLELRND